MSESLAVSFTKMVNLIDSETKFLKGISNLRGADSEVQDKLKHIDNSVNALEDNLDDFEAFVDAELAALSAIEEIGMQTELQHSDVQALKENIPQFMNTAPQNPPKREVLTDKRRQGPATDQRAPVQETVKTKETVKHSVSFQGSDSVDAARPDFTFITTEQLAAVPKSTRSRLTLAQVTTALQTLVALIADKRLVLVKTWKKSKRMSQAHKNNYEEYKRLLCDEHCGEMFLTEKEIRSSPIFETGEATGRAVLHTLRALRRLKQVRSGGGTTYIAPRK
mmetsp:Transcript_20032/g.33763  ORF Transcript_20032/g.33763 Transcript_20032/m.33763 type:complete len:279 (+) Transcript_20032:194-1030(+)